METLGSVLGGGELSWEQSGQLDIADLLFQAVCGLRSRFSPWFISWRISIDEFGSRAGKSS